MDHATELYGGALNGKYCTPEEVDRVLLSTGCPSAGFLDRKAQGFADEGRIVGFTAGHPQCDACECTLHSESSSDAVGFQCGSYRRAGRRQNTHGTRICQTGRCSGECLTVRAIVFFHSVEETTERPVEIWIKRNCLLHFSDFLSSRNLCVLFVCRKRIALKSSKIIRKDRLDQWREQLKNKHTSRRFCLSYERDDIGKRSENSGDLVRDG